MNDHQSPAEIEHTDDPHDRLVDRGLQELLGGQAPPDLSARILAAASTVNAPVAGATAVAEPEQSAPASLPQPPEEVRRGWWMLAAAACLLMAVGGAVFMMRPWGAAREAARRDSQETYQDQSFGKLHVVQSARTAQNRSDQSGRVNVAFGDGNVDGIPMPPTPLPRVTLGNGQASSLSSSSPHDPALVIVGTGRAERRDLRKRDANGNGPFDEARFFNDDGEYGGRIENLKAAEMKLLETQNAVRDPNSPKVRELREAVAVARGRVEEREKEIRAELGRAWIAPEGDEKGRGPGEGGDRYRKIVENPFLEALTNPLSTFSIDVDTASYANVRQFLTQQGTLPPPDAVRIEELVNYFRYNYAGPEDARPFAARMEVADCPWAPTHKLVRVAIKGRDIAPEKRPAANLVFLIDVSGSMDEPQKLPLLVQALKLLTGQLRGDDRVAIVVYAGSTGLVLPSTPGESRETILRVLDNLRAGGSTNGGAGIELAYKVAKENHIAEGINRVILCTDGDFNVGVTSDGALERLIEEKRTQDRTFLTVLGFGRGNFNDSMLEALAGKGNGNYAYVDNLTEARKVLVEQLTGTLLTIAKDVKIQIEFNPAKVAGYRLLGYEDRILAAEDFNDDKKDAGEIGSGHTVTALYEIVPPGDPVPAAKVDELKYQKPKQAAGDPTSNEVLTLKIRYKDPQADKSQLIETVLRDEPKKFAAATSDFQFAAAVAGFGMLLRGSEHKGNLTYDAVLEIASQHKGNDVGGYRAELLEMIRKAKQLAGN